MTIIGKRDKVVDSSKKIEEFIKGLSGKGHFGNSEEGVFIAVFGNIKVPPEIVEAIN